MQRLYILLYVILITTKFNSHGLAMIFPAGQFVSVRSYLIAANDMIFWIFPIVPCHAFCM